MKKRKFIMIILVVSLMLMGAGYASWSQAFSVANDVDTGELEVKVLTDWDDLTPAEFGFDSTAFDSHFYAAAWNKKENGAPYQINRLKYTWDKSGNKFKALYSARDNNDEALNDLFFTHSMTIPKTKDALSILIDNIYPGASYESGIYFKNTGTVPIDVTHPGELFIDNNIGNKLVAVSSTNPVVTEMLNSGVIEIHWSYVGKEGDMNPLKGKDEFPVTKETIEPGEVFRMSFRIQMNGATQEYENLKNLDFDFKFMFDQHIEEETNDPS
jgi:hypothetical protein